MSSNRASATGIAVPVELQFRIMPLAVLRRTAQAVLFPACNCVGATDPLYCRDCWKSFVTGELDGKCRACLRAISKEILDGRFQTGLELLRGAGSK